MTHRELCIKAARYLKYKGIIGFHKCQYVVCELERAGESPDAFGFGAGTTQLIEVKISRSDFLSDKKKFWRKNPQYGIGVFRSYLCPVNLIYPNELPRFWGLLWVDDKGQITIIKEPEAQSCNHSEELNLVTSLLRRNNIMPKIFSYKNYKNEE